MKILTPEDAKQEKLTSIPDFVYQAFNNLLVRNYDAYSITISQNEVIQEILRLCYLEDVTKETIFKNRWLDVEEEYRKNGWEVNYDKPGFNESGSAFFVFKPKKK